MKKYSCCPPFQLAYFRSYVSNVAIAMYAFSDKVSNSASSRGHMRRLLRVCAIVALGVAIAVGINAIWEFSGYARRLEARGGELPISVNLAAWRTRMGILGAYLLVVAGVGVAMARATMLQLD